MLGELQHYAELMRRVIDQTERRVLRGEKVAAQDKVYSIFEEHTDIIKKGQREPTFGLKVFLIAGKSSLILDCRVERGNPSDDSQFQPMLERIEQIYGRMPRQVSFDAGFTSSANLSWAKEEKGIQDVAFPRKGRMKVSDMVRSSWVYKQLKKFRAGIEGCISMLKRVFGAGRCTWKGWQHFCQYVQLSVVSFNLLVLARMRLA